MKSFEPFNFFSFLKSVSISFDNSALLNTQVHQVFLAIAILFKISAHFHQQFAQAISSSPLGTSAPVTVRQSLLNKNTRSSTFQ